MKNRIKELRKQKGLRQEDLAEILEVTRQTVIAIENNKYDPTLALAMRISEFFGVSVNEIFRLKWRIFCDCGKPAFTDRYYDNVFGQSYRRGKRYGRLPFYRAC